MYRTFSTTVVWRLMGCSALFLVVMAVVRVRNRSNYHDQITRLDHFIENATLGFEKILVLNMPQRTDHADWMKLSAAVSDLRMDFIDGVNGDDVLDKVLPYPPHRDLGSGNIGSWRAHMNAIAHVVSNNLTSALILEDDVDWDVRIKDQMKAFARGTRALSQPLSGTSDRHADPTFVDGRAMEQQYRHELLKDDHHFDFLQGSAPAVELPLLSPYGDDWDVLWPGHCSMHFVPVKDGLPKGRFLIPDDETVVPKSRMISADTRVWPGNYSESTRIVHHAWDPVCSYAYAVSQQGARKILWEFGIKRFDRAFDNLMAEFCDVNICLTIQPQLFSAFAAPGPVNRDSEINGFGQDRSTEIREVGRSENIQRSVRLNMQLLLRGLPHSALEDQYSID